MRRFALAAGCLAFTAGSAARAPARLARAAFPAATAAPCPATALPPYVADRDRDRSLAAGFQLHLGKPMDPGLLVQAIADVVATRRG